MGEYSSQQMVHASGNIRAVLCASLRLRGSQSLGRSERVKTNEGKLSCKPYDLQFDWSVRK